MSGTITLEQAAADIEKARNQAAELALEITRDLALAVGTESVRKGLESFFGLPDLEAILAQIDQFTEADLGWSEATERLLRLVGARRDV